jgi:hypothetical protein
MCRLVQGCHECDSDQSKLTQLKNLELAGLSGTPKHWRLQRACNRLHNDLVYAMRIYRERRRNGMTWAEQLAMTIRERVQAIMGTGIDLARLIQSQGTSWEQYAADPPPVLIMYRSFIAQTTTNTDPPRTAHGIHRELSVITCAGHC